MFSPICKSNIREAVTCRRGFSRFDYTADPDISINMKGMNIFFTELQSNLVIPDKESKTQNS
jgi:hypothetical protein